MNNLDKAMKGIKTVSFLIHLGHRLGMKTMTLKVLPKWIVMCVNLKKRVV